MELNSTSGAEIKHELTNASAIASELGVSLEAVISMTHALELKRQNELLEGQGEYLKEILKVQRQIAART